MRRGTETIHTWDFLRIDVIKALNKVFEANIPYSALMSLQKGERGTTLQFEDSDKMLTHMEGWGGK